uniref:Uncharacterized protein n=1 Tax=Panagrolaimus davidi TaxID=227884 RepID=A0A914QW59_9BILA
MDFKLFIVMLVAALGCVFAQDVESMGNYGSVKSYLTQLRRPSPSFRFPLVGESTLRQMRPWRAIRRSDNSVFDEGF